MRSRNSACRVFQKTVRLVVNYLRTQKAVVRVSPEVPLQSILPVICAKCDVSPEHVVLLRDNVAGEELELSKSLNELGIKELYAWDNKRGEATQRLRRGAAGPPRMRRSTERWGWAFAGLSNFVQTRTGVGGKYNTWIVVIPLSPSREHARYPLSPVSFHEIRKKGKGENTGASALKELLRSHV